MLGATRTLLSGQLVHFPLNRVAHCFTRRIIFVLVPRPEEASQAVFSAARNDMDVEVGDQLAHTIVDRDKGSFSIECRLNRRSHDLCALHHGSGERNGEIGQRLVVLTRAQKNVPRKQGIDV